MITTSLLLGAIILTGPCTSCSRVPRQNVVVQKQVVQKVQTVPVQKTVAVQHPEQFATFMAVSTPYYAELVGPRRDDTSDRITQLSEQVRALSSQITQLTGIEPTAESFSAFYADVPSGDAFNILRQHCARCHTGNSAKAGIRIFDNNGSLVNLSPTDKVLIDYSIYNKRMPKDNPSAVSDEEYNIIREWVAQDSRIRSELRR